MKVKSHFDSLQHSAKTWTHKNVIKVFFDVVNVNICFQLSTSSLSLVTAVMKATNGEHWKNIATSTSSTWIRTSFHRACKDFASRPLKFAVQNNIESISALVCWKLSFILIYFIPFVLFSWRKHFKFHFLTFHSLRVLCKNFSRICGCKI